MIEEKDMQGEDVNVKNIIQVVETTKRGPKLASPEDTQHDDNRTGMDFTKKPEFDDTGAKLLREIKLIEEQGSSLQDLSKQFGSIETLMKHESVPQIMASAGSIGGLGV